MEIDFALAKKKVSLSSCLENKKRCFWFLWYPFHCHKIILLKFISFWFPIFQAANIMHEQLINVWFMNYFFFIKYQTAEMYFLFLKNNNQSFLFIKLKSKKIGKLFDDVSVIRKPCRNKLNSIMPATGNHDNTLNKQHEKEME